MTTSGRAAKTSVAQGTKIDFKVRSTGTIAFVPVLHTLTVLLGLNTTDVLAALPLVSDLQEDYFSQVQLDPEAETLVWPNGLDFVLIRFIGGWWRRR